MRNKLMILCGIALFSVRFPGAKHWSGLSRHKGHVDQPLASGLGGVSGVSQAVQVQRSSVAKNTNRHQENVAICRTK